MTTMTPITEILRNARHSVDFGEAPDDPDQNAQWWQHIIIQKAGDSGFGALLDSIMTQGFDPYSPIGWQPASGSITEGHHRLVAAILLGIDEVPTDRWGGGDGTICAHDCGPYCDSDGGFEHYPVDLA